MRVSLVPFRSRKMKKACFMRQAQVCWKTPSQASDSPTSEPAGKNVLTTFVSRMGGPWATRRRVRVMMTSTSMEIPCGPSLPMASVARTEVTHTCMLDSIGQPAVFMCDAIPKTCLLAKKKLTLDVGAFLRSFRSRGKSFAFAAIFRFIPLSPAHASTTVSPQTYRCHAAWVPAIKPSFEKNARITECAKSHHELECKCHATWIKKRSNSTC